MTRHLFPAALSLAAMIAAAPALAETWQMSAHDPDGNFHTENVRLFAEDVAEKSGGALTLDVKSNAVLLSRTDLKRGVQRGVVPIGEVLISALANEDPIYAADNVPGLATTFEEAKALWDASKPVYEAKLAEEGMMVLWSEPWPPQGIYMKEPIESAADLQGVKFRAYSPTTARFAELLGAVPATVASGEIGQAFSTGLISGMLTSPTTGVDSQAWDFVNHYYDVKAFIPKNFVLVNKAAFDALPTESQKALTDAAAEAETRGWQMAQEATEKATATLQENGMEVHEAPEALAADLATVGETMRDEWIAAGNDGVNAIVDGYQK